MATKLKKIRWTSCNVLQSGESSRRLWIFNVGKNGFNFNQEQNIPAAQPLPAKFVGRDWHTLLKPRLNIAWLPMEQVFLRVIQLPVSAHDELMAMTELQLEKLSPLPVTQIVWSAHLLPNPVDNLQTIIVVMVSRDVVENFLGELEGQGFLADRLEFPLLDQLLATSIRADGGYIYPDKTTGKLTALVAWWYGGSLRSVGLIHIPSSENRAEALKEQLTQMAWSGELEGWLHSAPVWHLVADDETAQVWQPLFTTWLTHSIEVIKPIPDTELAILNANRAGRSDDKITILPPEYTKRYQQEFHDRLWMRGLFSIVGVYCFGILVYLSIANWQGFKADGRVSEMNGISRQYTNTMLLKAQLEILENRQALKLASLDCWRTTAELLPAGVAIQSLDFKDGKLSLSGKAPGTGDDLTDFNAALRKAMNGGKPMFSEVQVPTRKLEPDRVTLSWSFTADIARVEDSK